MCVLCVLCRYSTHTASFGCCEISSVAEMLLHLFIDVCTIYTSKRACVSQWNWFLLQSHTNCACTCCIVAYTRNCFAYFVLKVRIQDRLPQTSCVERIANSYMENVVTNFDRCRLLICLYLSPLSFHLASLPLLFSHSSAYRVCIAVWCFGRHCLLITLV